MRFGIMLFAHFGDSDCYTVAFNSKFRSPYFRFKGFDDYGFPAFWIDFGGFQIRNDGIWLQDDIPF